MSGPVADELEEWARTLSISPLMSGGPRAIPSAGTGGKGYWSFRKKWLSNWLLTSSGDRAPSVVGRTLSFRPLANIAAVQANLGWSLLRKES